MRVFESNQFRDDYIEGVNGVGYEYPDEEETKDALNYVSQFVQRGSRELLRGYMSSECADALVRLRDANSSRKLNDATKAFCVDGSVSREASVSGSTQVTLPNNTDVVRELGDEYYETDNSEAKSMIRTAQEVIRTNRGESVELWLPSEVVESVATFRRYA